ncbi:MAG: carbohydrate ABC transporter permease [Planctomycetes bacterium]|nr:carbohydrate ABC transporter permease [Planctomycetota bacterium]
MSARVLRWVALVVCASLFALPLVYMLSVSLHREGTGLGGSLADLAHDAHPENYGVALEKMGDFPRLLANTVVVTVLSIAGQLLTCSLAGYAFARIEFRGRDALFVAVLATMMLPEQVSAIPRFLVFRSLGMVDTFAPLVLPAVLGGAPFFIFLFRQYFLTLPAELTEAARIDGCGHLRIWWSIALPLARPMLVTVGIFTFLAAWNDFWSPLVYLFSPERSTLSLALASFNRTYDTAVEHMMAASAVVLAPCLIVYFVAQKLFLRGVQVAASKH